MDFRFQMAEKATIKKIKISTQLSRRKGEKGFFQVKN